jgi:UDP-glucose 4-epimerase
MNNSSVIAITGGTGFIGSNLLLKLSELGYKVRALYRSTIPKHLAHLQVTWVNGDLYRKEDIEHFLKGSDVLIHAAADGNPGKGNDDLVGDLHLNLIPSLNMLQSTVKHKLKRVIYLSSGGAVYGASSSLPIAETSPCHPISSYGVQKLALEKYLGLIEFQHGITAISLRISNPYGPFQKYEKKQGLINSLIHNYLIGMPVQIYGDGSIVRDYLHIDDTVSAVLKSITYQGDTRVLNIGSGVGRSISGLILEIESILKIQFRKEYFKSRPADIPANILDNRLAMAELVWSPQFSFERGIREYFEWYKNRLDLTGG